jgi:soluble lytic murein transglycosylase-like protein
VYKTGLLASGLVAGLALTVPAMAGAQVLEIGTDGIVTTHSGPAVYLAQGTAARPIAETPAKTAPDRTSAGLTSAIAQSAARHGLSPRVVEAVAWQESRFNAAAISPKGAIGVMQLMPGTAAELGVNARDPASNVEGGTVYLAKMLDTFDGDLTLALAAYNAGPRAVQRYGGTPPFAETQAYVKAVLGRLATDAERAQ